MNAFDDGNLLWCNVKEICIHHIIKHHLGCAFMLPLFTQTAIPLAFRLAGKGICCLQCFWYENTVPEVRPGAMAKIMTKSS